MSTFSLEKDNTVISDYLRENASDLIESEQFAKHLTQICLQYLYISMPYRFSDKPDKHRFEYSNDGMTVKCVSVRNGNYAVMHVNPPVNDNLPQLSLRIDIGEGNTLEIGVENENGDELRMKSTGIFAEGRGLSSWGMSPAEPWDIGRRHTKVGDVLSIWIVKDTKTIVFGINEHRTQIKDHFVMSGKELFFKHECHGTGNQVTIVPCEKL